MEKKRRDGSAYKGGSHKKKAQRAQEGERQLLDRGRFQMEGSGGNSRKHSWRGRMQAAGGGLRSCEQVEIQEWRCQLQDALLEEERKAGEGRSMELAGAAGLRCRQNAGGPDLRGGETPAWGWPGRGGEALKPTPGASRRGETLGIQKKTWRTGGGGWRGGEEPSGGGKETQGMVMLDGDARRNKCETPPQRGRDAQLGGEKEPCQGRQTRPQWKAGRQARPWTVPPKAALEMGGHKSWGWTRGRGCRVIKGGVPALRGCPPPQRGSA